MTFVEAEPQAPAAARANGAMLAEHSAPDGEPVTPGNGSDAALMAKAQALVEGTIRSQGSIARELGIDAKALSNWKVRLGWVRPEGAPKAPDFGRDSTGLGNGRSTAAAELRRRRLIDRLYHACSLQVRQIETRLRSNTQADEKDARTLGTLARTLDTLMALERDNGTTADKPEAVNRDELNAELTRRITRWAEGGEEDR
jgi:hypothetical protein